MAEHITNLYPGYHIEIINIIPGKRLQPGETGSGLYGIMSSKGKLLRATPIREVAEFLTQDPSRHIVECWIGA